MHKQQVNRPSRSNVARNIVILMAIMAASSVAFAGAGGGGESLIKLDFIDKIGCGIVLFMQSTLAPIVLALVIVSAIVIGMISKVDWSKIITVLILFGILMGIGKILSTAVESGSVKMPSCITAG